MAANVCVLFTGNDAYARDLHLAVPADCVASNTEGENRYARVRSYANREGGRKDDRKTGAQRPRGEDPEKAAAAWQVYQWVGVARGPYFVWVSLATVLQRLITALNWGSQ